MLCLVAIVDCKPDVHYTKKTGTHPLDDSTNVGSVIASYKKIQLKPHQLNR